MTNKIKKIVNVSELSRHITGGDRNALRKGNFPRKHWDKLDRFFKEDLPEMWEDMKRELSK